MTKLIKSKVGQYILTVPLKVAKEAGLVGGEEIDVVVEPNQGVVVRIKRNVAVQG